MSVHPYKSCHNTHRVYMIAVSYYQGRSILNGTCALVGYFDLLIFSHENINLPGDLCTVGLFWCFDLWPSHYDSYLENLDDVHHSNLVQAITQKLYILAVSFFQGRSILLEHCTLSDYWPLLRKYKWQLILPLPWKYCAALCLETINDNNLEGISN